MAATPIAALADTHKIIWHGKYLDGTLTILTEKEVQLNTPELTVTFVVQSDDGFYFTGQAQTENSNAGLNTLLPAIEKAYKAAVVEEAQELQEVYGSKLN